MKLINQLKEMLFPFSEVDIMEEFEDRLERSQFEGVKVNAVDITEFGIAVDFEDFDGDILSAFFIHDEEDGSTVLVDDYDNEFEFDEFYGQETQGIEEMPQDMIVVDLNAIQPPLISGGNSVYINLTNLNWMSDSVLMAILNADEVDDLELEPEVLEAMTTVVRGGKKVRVALVRRKRRKRLSPKQKAGIRKAVIKRKAKSNQITRKRKKSLKIRKRLNVKKNTNKHFKVAGTSDRKR